MSPSSLLVLLGVSGRVSGLRHHNLFFDESLDQHAKEIYQGALPLYPTYNVGDLPRCPLHLPRCPLYIAMAADSRGRLSYRTSAAADICDYHSGHLPSRKEGRHGVYADICRTSAKPRRACAEGPLCLASVSSEQGPLPHMRAAAAPRSRSLQGDAAGSRRAPAAVFDRSN